LRDERSNLLWPIRPACRRPPRPKQSNWWSAIRSTLSWDRSLPLNGSVYIRKVKKKAGKLVNTTIRSYPDVSQFWHYDPKEFLKQPVFSRDFPPLKS
jgi:hypothetical protein